MVKIVMPRYIRIPRSLLKSWKEDDHPRNDNGRFANGGNAQAVTLPEITGVKSAEVNVKNWHTVASGEFEKIRARIKAGLVCPAAGNKKVVGIIRDHLENKNAYEKRKQLDILRRVRLMPFIVPIIERGALTANRNAETYEVSAKAGVATISVVLVEKNGKNGKGLLYLSVINRKTKNVGKSLARAGGQTAQTAHLGQEALRAVERGTFPTDHDLIIPYVVKKSSHRLVLRIKKSTYREIMKKLRGGRA